MKDNTKTAYAWWWAILPLSIALGTAAGALIGNIGLGMAAGAASGTPLNLFFSYRRKKASREGSS